MRLDQDSLADILERIALTYEFVKEGRDVFLQSRLIQEAVIRNLEIIGESSRNISEDLRKNHPEIAWKQIAAFRNFVIHAYWAINLERVWQIIENDLPPLKTQIDAVLASFKKDEDEAAKPDSTE
jgi:uncharacterized protein with HEPN domain